MAIINKPDTLTFAGNAPVGEIEQYPEMQRGIAVIFERFQGIPPMEMFNYLFKRFDEKSLYLWQQGIPEWADDIDYPRYAVVKKSGSFYHASQANNNKDPSVTSNATFWTKWFVSASDLSELLSGKSDVGHKHSWSDFNPTKPTTMEGYGIVDGIKVVGSTPSTKIGDVVYVIDKACFMRWQTIGSWTGYASDALMSKVDGTTVNPAPNEIDLIGGTYSKSSYPALWAKVQVNNHVVAANVWRDKIFKFVDLGGDNFKVPDLRNTFIRATGTDADSSNARELGSYQGDAMRRLYGAFSGISYSSYSNEPGSSWFNDQPLFKRINDGDTGWTNSQVTTDASQSTLRMRTTAIRFDTAMVSPASTETRTVNTAFHLRLCAY